MQINYSCRAEICDDLVRKIFQSYALWIKKLYHTFHVVVKTKCVTHMHYGCTTIITIYNNNKNTFFYLQVANYPS